jgi:transposase
MVQLRPSGGDHRSKLAGKNLERVRRMVEQQPDLTLEQLRDEIQKRLKIKLSVMAVCRALQRLGLSFKKSPSMPASVIDRTSSRSVVRLPGASARSR